MRSDGYTIHQIFEKSTDRNRRCRQGKFWYCFIFWVLDPLCFRKSNITKSAKASRKRWKAKSIWIWTWRTRTFAIRPSCNLERMPIWNLASWGKVYIFLSLVCALQKFFFLAMKITCISVRSFVQWVYDTSNIVQTSFGRCLLIQARNCKIFIRFWWTWKLRFWRAWNLVSFYLKAIVPQFFSLRQIWFHFRRKIVGCIRDGCRIRSSTTTWFIGQNDQEHRVSEKFSFCGLRWKLKCFFAFSFGMGIEFRESSLLINAKNAVTIEQGELFFYNMNFRPKFLFL